MAADAKSTLKLFFDCRFHTLHTQVPTQIWDMCLCILSIILKYADGTCLWLYWKLTLNTHFLLDFIYFHETIDFSLTSVTSSHVQIWKIVTPHRNWLLDHLIISVTSWASPNLVSPNNIDPVITRLYSVITWLLVQPDPYSRVTYQSARVFPS